MLAACTSADLRISPDSHRVRVPDYGTAATDTTSKSADLDRALEELVAMPGGPPGAISVVQVGNEQTVHTAGVSDLATGAAPAIGDHMRVASAAKAFSGAAALSLVDQGILSLDDTIGKWLPDMPAAWAAVTLRQLLSHTSGLPDFTQSPGVRSGGRGVPHRRAAARSTADVSCMTSPWSFPPAASTCTTTPTTSLSD